MMLPREGAPPAAAARAAGAGWRRAAALAFAVAAIGLPLNQVAAYLLLLIVAVIIFTGEVTGRASAWVAAAAIVVAALGGQWLLSPPRIAEGHNVFLPGPPDGVLQRSLPAAVYRHMADEFDRQYPPAVRCRPGAEGCWQGSAPERAFAFSADSVFHPSELSRAVTGVDFSDPVSLRLGFINELRYNWYTLPPDVHRADRDRRFWMGLNRWHLAMPWFEAIRLPAAFAGGELCWRGDVMWEGADGQFAVLPADGCRAIEASDAGRRIFGIAVKPGTLAMHLTAPWPVRLWQHAGAAVALAAVLALIVVLVRVQVRRAIVPLILLALALLVIAIDDASFVGGVRPFDGGDDGLFYDGVGRAILQNFLAGDVYGALEGGEKVFYYGGPGLRYFRALEHVVFGESYLGYLSLVLLLPLLTWGLARRFLPQRWALALALIFVAIPVGELFGTTFLDYAKWAARGFADPAAYILLHCRAAAACWRYARRSEREFCSGVLRCAAARARDRHEADRAACRGRYPWRRRRRGARVPAMAAGGRPVHRLRPGPVHGPAQLDLRPCLCAAERECRPPRRAGDAALRLCPGVCANCSL